MPQKQHNSSTDSCGKKLFTVASNHSPKFNCTEKLFALETSEGLLDYFSNPNDMMKKYKEINQMIRITRLEELFLSFLDSLTTIVLN